MTKTFVISTCCFVAFLLGGCKSNSTGPGSSNNNNIPSGMTATINGKAWSGQVVGFRHGGVLNNLQFEGFVNTPFEQMPFGASPTIAGPGTYTLVQNDQTSGNIIEASYNTDTASFSDNVSGMMTITVLTSNNVQGTFNFKATGGVDDQDTLVVSNGQFNVPLQ